MSFTSTSPTSQKLALQNDCLTRDHRSLSILFVDDEKFTRDLFRKVMVAYGIPDVTIAESGDDALRRVNENYFDIVITDIMMKGTNGLHLAKEIRRRTSPAGTKAGVPIIVLTAHGEERIVRACAQAGANGFLIKPLVPAKLMQSIAKLCHCSPPTLVSSDNH